MSVSCLSCECLRCILGLILFLKGNVWNPEDVPGACNLGCYHLGSSVCRKAMAVLEGVGNPAIKPWVGLHACIPVLFYWPGGLWSELGFAMRFPVTLFRFGHIVPWNAIVRTVKQGNVLLCEERTEREWCSATKMVFVLKSTNNSPRMYNKYFV